MIACCLSGVAPRWRIRERPPHGIWLPASRKPEGCTWVKVSGAGLTDREAQAPEPFWQAENAESPLAGRRTASFVFAWQLRLIPVRRKFVAWDCKVTPAAGTCQEGNTTGCIPSNGGLDAGLRRGFPHPGQTGAAFICGVGHGLHFGGPYFAGILTRRSEAPGWFHDSLRDQVVGFAERCRTLPAIAGSEAIRSCAQRPG